MTLADVVPQAQEPASGVFDRSLYHLISTRILELKARATPGLARENITNNQIDYEVYPNLRCQGIDNLLMILEFVDGDYLQAFLKEHQREFDFTFPGCNVLIEEICVRGVERSVAVPEESPGAELSTVTRKMWPFNHVWS